MPRKGLCCIDCDLYNIVLCDARRLFYFSMLAPEVIRNSHCLPVNRNMAVAIGLELAGFLSFLLEKYEYKYSRNELDSDGGFMLPAADVSLETGFSTRAQDRLILSLKELLIVTTKVKQNSQGKPSRFLYFTKDADVAISKLCNVTLPSYPTQDHHIYVDHRWIAKRLYIYFLFYENNIVYIGSSSHPKSRLYAHKASSEKEFDSFSFIVVPIRFAGLGHKIECLYINTYKPKYNKAFVHIHANTRDYVAIDPFSIKRHSADCIKETNYDI